MATDFREFSYDISQNFGSDFSFSARNDLLTSSDIEKSRQRVLRRLLTNPGDYIWHPQYGTGLQRFIGQSLSSDRFDEIRSLITSQIFLEESVAKTPQPVILLQTIQGGLFVQINYTQASTQSQVMLTFDVGIG